MRRENFTTIALTAIGTIPLNESHTLSELPAISPECDHMYRSLITGQIVRIADRAQCMEVTRPEKGNIVTYTRKFLPGEICKDKGCDFAKGGQITRCPLYFANKEE